VTYPARLLEVGVGLEATYGVPVAPAKLWLVDTCSPVDRHTPIPDESWRSSVGSSSGHRPGPLDGTLAIGGPVLPDTIGYPLAGVLGDVTVVGASAPFTASMAPLNTGTQQPPSYTLVTSDPVGALQWPGARFSQLALSLTPDGLFTFAATADALASITAASLNLAASAVGVLAGWRGVVTLGGSVEARCESVTVTITRALDAKRNVNGSRTPYHQRAGLVTVTGEALVIMSSDAYRAAFVAGTATSVDVAIGQGAGAAQTKVQVHSSSVTLTGAARQYGQKWVEVALAWVADQNATDVGASGGLSAVKATLINAVPAGTYK
jgi:tail tube protein